MVIFTKNHFMDIHAGQQRRFPAVAIVVVLFTLCVTVGQVWITKQFPAISGLAQMHLSLVFMEIPIQLPVGIDLILAPALFLLIYPVVIVLYPSRPGRALQRVRAAFTGFFALLCSMLCGGLIYYLAQDHLTKQVRNGINSLGINADIHLSYPGYETIYLRGSMILFVCFIIGMVICIRKIRKDPWGGLTREQCMTPYERMLQEKRMQKKQMMPGAPTMQNGYNNDNSWQSAGIAQESIPLNINAQSRLCCSQPVMRLRPEAIYFMPK